MARSAKTQAHTPRGETHRGSAFRRVQLLAALGAAIRDRRAKLGLSRQALARRAGLSERFLAQLESGRGNVSVAKLAELARALAAPASALLIAAARRAADPALDLALDLVTEIGERLERATPELLQAALGRLGGAGNTGPDGDGPAARPLIALLGLRGSGKSTVGPLLAERLGIPFHETDDLIAEQCGLALSDIFALHGEGYYREAERRALSGLIARRERAVAAMSGGIVNDPAAFDMLKRHALLVWLYTTPEDYMARVEAQGDYRPMRNRPNAMNELRALLRQRTPLYRQAHVALDTANLDPHVAMERVAAMIAAYGERPPP